MRSITATWSHVARASLLVLAGVSGSACAHASSEDPSPQSEQEHAEVVPAEQTGQQGSETAAETPSTHGAVVVVSQEMCPLVVERNTTLEIHLGGNPSTGYGWQITNGATGVLTSRGEPSQSEGSGLPGSPAEYVFRFDAVAAGEGRLALAYRQSWNTAVAPAATFECAISVR